jgi:hypothetical protein
VCKFSLGDFSPRGGSLVDGAVGVGFAGLLLPHFLLVETFQQPLVAGFFEEAEQIAVCFGVVEGESCEVSVEVELGDEGVRSADGGGEDGPGGLEVGQLDL